MDFEWEEAKAAVNLEKHGVSFADAASSELRRIIKSSDPPRAMPSKRVQPTAR